MARKKHRARNFLIGTAVTLLTAGAVAEQLQRPAAERTWHGKIAGVPYDFRIPSAEKIQATIWNKDDPRLFVPHAFGLGWSVNFYPLLNPQPRKIS